jgi:ArsR family transcriptional regulator
VRSRFEITFLENASETLRAIAHPVRIAMIDLLKTRKKLSVTEIHEELDIEQAVASHHLRILKDRQVLVAQRDGKNTFYSLRAGDYSKIIQSLEKLS